MKSRYKVPHEQRRPAVDRWIPHPAGRVVDHGRGGQRNVADVIMPSHWRAAFTLAHPPRQLHHIGRALRLYLYRTYSTCRAQRATHACFAITQPLAGNRRATLRDPEARNSTLFVPLSVSFSLALSLSLSSSFSLSLYDNDSHCRRRDGGGDGNRPCGTRPCE